MNNLGFRFRTLNLTEENGMEWKSRGNPWEILQSSLQNGIPTKITAKKIIIVS
jgi:hypothetical protein